jgi:transposase
MVYGLDVHKRFIQVCALSADGKQRKDLRIGASRVEVEAFARTLRRRDRVVLEATFHTWALHRILARRVGQVVVANPLQVKAIAHAKIKTDKVDAHILAQLLRADLIPEVQMPDAATWRLRQLISQRRLLVKHRTAAKNTIHALLNRLLIHYPGSDLFAGPGRRWLRDLELEKHERFLADNALAHLDSIAARIRAVDVELLQIASVEEQVKLLMTIPGIDVTVAIGFLAAIGDVRRFETPDRLAAYFGLVPRVRQSAGRCHHGGITKTGNSTARYLAIEAAQSLARASTPLVATYHRVRRKRGHNVAVTALARKLVVVVWYLLTRHEPYRYAPVERTRTKLRAVTPGRTRTRSGQVPQTLEAVYAAAQLKPPAAPSPAEKRAAARNRATVTRLRGSRT